MTEALPTIPVVEFSCRDRKSTRLNSNVDLPIYEGGVLIAAVLLRWTGQDVGELVSLNDRGAPHDSGGGIQLQQGIHETVIEPVGVGQGRGHDGIAIWAVGVVFHPCHVVE